MRFWPEIFLVFLITSGIILNINILTFKKSICKTIWKSSNVTDSSVTKLITRLRLGFSQLCEQKFRHNFQDTLNPICICAENIKTTIHYLLYCPNYLNERMTLLNNLQNVEENILDRNCSRLSEVLLFKFYHSIQYIFDTKRFDVPLTHLINLQKKLQKFEKSIYCAVSSMKRDDLILIRLSLVLLYIDFHFV